VRVLQAVAIASVLLFTPFLDGGRDYRSLLFVHLLLLFSLLALSIRNEVFEGAKRLPAAAVVLVCAYLGSALVAGLLAPYRYGAFLRLLDLFAAVAFGLLYLSFVRRQPATGSRFLLFPLIGLSLFQSVYLFSERTGFTAPGSEPLFFRNPNYAAVYMAAGAVLALGLALEKHSIPARSGFLFVFLISAGGVVLTASRTAILALAAASLIPLWKMRRILAFVPIVLLALLFLMPNPFRERIRHLGSDIYAWKRTDIWRLDLRMWSDHPLLGVGPGQFAYYSPAYNFPVPEAVGRYRKTAELPHNAFLGALLEGGPVCFLALCGLCLLVLTRESRRRRGSSAGGGEGGGGVAAFFVIAVAGLFSDPLEVPALLYLFTALGGAALVRAFPGSAEARAFEGGPEASKAPLRSPLVPSWSRSFLLLFLFSFAGVRLIALPFWAHREFRKAENLRGKADSRAIERRAARAVFLDRGNPLYHEFLGGIYARRLRESRDIAWYCAGRKELEEAARLNPREPGFLTALIELEGTADLPGSRHRIKGLLGRAERLSPFNPFFPFEHALLLLSEGNPEGSRSLLKRAVSIEPDFMRARYYLFRIASSRGEWERAREEASRAARICETRRGYRTGSPYEAQLLSIRPEELAELERFRETEAGGEKKESE
jgi:O-antigen ligase